MGVRREPTLRKRKGWASRDPLTTPPFAQNAKDGPPGRSEKPQTFKSEGLRYTDNPAQKKIRNGARIEILSQLRRGSLT